MYPYKIMLTTLLLLSFSCLALVGMAQQPKKIDEFPEVLNPVKKLFGENKYKKALKKLDVIIKKAPRYAQAYLLQGDIYGVWQKDQPDKVYQAYEKAIELAPYWEKPYSFYASELVQNGLVQEAIDLYTVAIERMPQSSEMYFKRGQVAEYHQKNYVQALEDYGEAIDLAKVQRKPGKYTPLGKYYACRASLWRSVKNYDEAVKDYNLLVEAIPAHDSYNIRASLYAYVLDDYPKALADYQQALILAPDEETKARYKKDISYCKKDIIRGYTVKARKLYFADNYPEAIKWAKKSLTTATNFGVEIRKEAQQILQNAEEKLKIQQDKQAWHNKVLTCHKQGVALWEVKKYKEALATFKKCNEMISYRPTETLLPLRKIHLKYKHEYIDIEQQIMLKEAMDKALKKND